MPGKSFYVTTPIYYPSDRLHIGHALTTTMADTLSRYHRMRGYVTWFLTGSDEHGQKIERKAKEAGVSPKEYVDRIVASFQHLWHKLDIKYDDFIRTTEQRHMEVVQKLFKTIYDKGDIYKSEYEGWYCTPCETFWTERQVPDRLCPNPDCRRPVELVKEESYFFKMGKYTGQLLKHIEDNPDFIQPVSRRNEMVSFINGGLEDLCVSRTTFDWGIPVPVDDKHVIYVWFDALTNYISALGVWQEDDSKFRQFWPVALHLVGKDIVRFHTVIWPIMLMAAGLEPPKKVLGHGWLLVEGGKMSKSKGNVVDPLVLIEKYGSDAIRYFLLREMPYGSDGYYSEDSLINRINSDLANDYGNLLSRCTAMIEKFRGGGIPRPGGFEALDKELADLAGTIPGEVERSIQDYQFSQALAAIWRLVKRANKYIEETAPWVLAKDARPERLNTVLYNLAEAMRVCTVLISPFMPSTPPKVWAQLGLSEREDLHTWDSILAWGGLPPGIKVQRGDPIFPRVETEEESPQAGPVEVAPDHGPELSIEDFARVDLRVAEVLAAEKVEKADKLLKLAVRVDQEERTIVAGIARHYEPGELVGKKVIIVFNLKPAKLRGITSQGMLLAASAGEELALLTVDRSVSSGAKVK